MRIVIPCVQPSFDSELAPSFGSAPYYAFVDTEDMVRELQVNPYFTQTVEREERAAQFIQSRCAKALLTNTISPTAHQLLRDSNVIIVPGVKGKVSEVLETYLQSGAVPMELVGAQYSEGGTHEGPPSWAITFPG